DATQTGPIAAARGRLPVGPASGKFQIAFDNMVCVFTITLYGLSGIAKRHMPGGTSMRKALIAFGMLLAAAVVPQAQGQAQEKWPTDSITIIVPFAPGGATDFSARLAGEKLAQRLGVTVVVE